MAVAKFMFSIGAGAFGVYCLVYSVKGKEFYFARRVSKIPNQRMPAWFGRPLLFAMGLFWIFAAVGYFRQELSGPIMKALRHW